MTAMSCAGRGRPDLVSKWDWRELCQGAWVFWNEWGPALGRRLGFIRAIRSPGRLDRHLKR